MQLKYVFLAEGAESPNNNAIDVRNADPDWFQTATYPFVLPRWKLVLKVHMTLAECAFAHRIVAELWTPSQHKARTLLNREFRVAPMPHERTGKLPVRVTEFFELEDLIFETPGIYKVPVFLDQQYRDALLIDIADDPLTRELQELILRPTADQGMK
jgi:hypothetical protein